MNSKGINRNVWALTLTLCLGVIGYSTLSAQAADPPKMGDAGEERKGRGEVETMKKAGEKPKAGETTLAALEPNKVTLSASKNVVSQKGCAVTAFVGAKCPVPCLPVQGRTVNFAKVPSGPVIGTGVSGANGNTSPFTVPWNTTIRAEVQVTYQPNPLTSNQFACGAKYPTP